MKRYETKTWHELVRIQNSMPLIDILTITALMDDEELEQHLTRYKKIQQQKEEA